MGRFVLRRLLQAVPTLLGIMVLTFALTRLAPADPLDFIVGGVTTDVSPERIAALRAEYGLDRPLPLQFLDWAWRAARLDLGNSFFYHRPVAQLILERLPNTLRLSLAALAVSLAIGVPLGIVAALNRGRAVDHAIRILSVVGHAIPAFWFGLLFILVLAVQLRWFPIGSMYTLGHTDVPDQLWHMVGPVLTLALTGIANYPRYLRTEILEILGQDYVRTARSKGLRERVVVIGHVLRNALIPIVTLLGGVLTIVVAGSVVIEQVFTWPGLGRLFFEAANQKDYPLWQASVLTFSVLLVMSYILRDIAYAWVDPRIKVR